MDRGDPRRPALDAPVVLVATLADRESRPVGPTAAFWAPHLAAVLGARESRLTDRPGAAPTCLVDGTPLAASASRTAGARALAVAATGPVGVDIERAVTLDDADRLLDLALAPEEAAALRATEHQDLCPVFLALWTQKEAVLKAAGLGLRAEPREVRLAEPGAPVTTGLLRGGVCRVWTRAVGDWFVSCALTGDHAEGVRPPEPGWVFLEESGTGGVERWRTG
jgi:hypothetical protein